MYIIIFFTQVSLCVAKWTGLCEKYPLSTRTSLGSVGMVFGDRLAGKLEHTKLGEALQVFSLNKLTHSLALQLSICNLFLQATYSWFRSAEAPYKVTRKVAFMSGRRFI